MLIRFAVENFKSYKDQQVFSMIAGKHTKHKDHIINANGKRILKGSFFFGANAAGKSNLFEAISFAQSIVLSGFRKKMLSKKYFRIDPSYLDRPGVFQFDIYTNGHFYSYGFSISYKEAIIEEEWLYLCDSSEIAIFERFSEDGKTVVNTDFKFSSNEQEQTFKVFSENVPDDKMLLLEISERKLIENKDFSAYRDVIEWLKKLLVILPESQYGDKNSMFSNENQKIDLAKILNSFDTGIEKIVLGEESMEEALDFLPDQLKEKIMQDIEDGFNEKNKEDNNQLKIQCDIGGKFIEFYKKNNEIFASQLMMDHGNPDDPFELYDESDGTQRLFDLIPVYRATEKPYVILVDELDRSFHTKLVQNFIQLFYSSTEGIESQLIASVHDSNVMDLELLRQDEIWFVERQKDHSTTIYSLNKYQERFDKKVAKDYLLGRYGAIPCISQIELSESEEV